MRKNHRNPTKKRNIKMKMSKITKKTNKMNKNKIYMKMIMMKKVKMLKVFKMSVMQRANKVKFLRKNKQSLTKVSQIVHSWLKIMLKALNKIMISLTNNNIQ